MRSVIFSLDRRQSVAAYTVCKELSIMVWWQYFSGSAKQTDALGSTQIWSTYLESKHNAASVQRVILAKVVKLSPKCIAKKEINPFKVGDRRDIRPVFGTADVGRFTQMIHHTGLRRTRPTEAVLVTALMRQWMLGIDWYCLERS
jgi:hypothetical protein